MGVSELKVSKPNKKLFVMHITYMQANQSNFNANYS